MQHIPVLLNEVIKSLNIEKNGIYIDGTFGNGGHTKEILKYLSSNGRVLGFDRDPLAFKSGKKINDSRLLLFNDVFSNILKYTTQLNLNKKINGMILDLGLSSFQIKNSKRGFSFQKNGPLDMRMNPLLGFSLSQKLNFLKEEKLSKILKNFGNEKYAKKIAFLIKKYQKKKPILTTFELVKIIKQAVPLKYPFKNPATRTFLALRIYINQELKELKKILNISLKILKPGAILAIISFNSSEDRIIKNFFKKNSSIIKVPMGLPITETELKKRSKKKIENFKKIKPTKKEINTNKKSRSAILRFAKIL
ncbi:16S rRNA (cytosine(1402)-N(4))-methyltransferase RsmH [Buchnera aphidicola]|uniref:Ribosomal RNA small subunit methyltransferase H n=1 Tax=Buchnera aphidicola subsp. Tuberolachnus salignus TaxID=98804 RepID=A0A160SVX4_BUCTT|nr:16S rRNA (cytosine(1402)-N(4))-methyltransferase RsmH [Buchnera aphidicola]CUR53127.1 Ribosomal RNA small subunit methyltransferase H [Buchnera aphidicola (Tuberolachnus salignus)]